MEILSAIKQFVESHGFDCYISTDNEVVIRIPVWNDKFQALTYEVKGAETINEAKIAIGY